MRIGWYMLAISKFKDGIWDGWHLAVITAEISDVVSPQNPRREGGCVLPRKTALRVLHQASLHELPDGYWPSKGT